MFSRLCFFLFVVLTCSGNCYAGNLKVVAVIDGDTLLVEDNKALFHMAIYGLDAPEVGQAYAEDASKYVSELLHNNKYTIQLTDKSNFKSGVVRYIDNKTGVNRSLACAVIYSGLGFYDRRLKNHKRDSIYFNSEKDAKEKKLGLWSDKNIETPWAYRDRNSVVDIEEIEAKQFLDKLGEAISKTTSSSTPYDNYGDCYIYERNKMLSELNTPSTLLGSVTALRLTSADAAMLCAGRFGGKVTIKSGPAQPDMTKFNEMSDKIDRIDRKLKYGW